MNNLKRQEPLLVARAARAALLVPSSVPSSAPCQYVGRDLLDRSPGPAHSSGTAALVRS